MLILIRLKDISFMCSCMHDSHDVKPEISHIGISVFVFINTKNHVLQCEKQQEIITLWSVIMDVGL